MSKSIVRNPEVVNIITEALFNSKDKYIVCDSEWNNGTRPDLVFEPKAPIPESPPIVVEFRYTVNEEFMRRVTDYGLEASKRYKRSPIILIVCVNTMSSGIDQRILPASRIPSSCTVPSQSWASECLILCESSHFNNELASCWHKLAMEHYESNARNQLHPVDVLGKVLATQEREYDNLLELVNSDASSETISQAIELAKSRNKDLKRKYIDIDDSDVMTQSTSSLAFQRGMEFVKRFKKARMDWVTCLSEGRKVGLLKYNNTATPYQKTLFVYNLEIKLRSAVAAERRASINVRTAKKD
ncbi:hypothetical protein MFLAVUS_007174 [Mucor flavus]|uniref:Uncharacterized protein n=1 Tax=Mucor flavus TaxID=439312 RepID=A0ABP9Z3K9_9FUNG